MQAQAAFVSSKHIPASVSQRRGRSGCSARQNPRRSPRVSWSGAARRGGVSPLPALPAAFPDGRKSLGEEFTGTRVVDHTAAAAHQQCHQSRRQEPQSESLPSFSLSSPCASPSRHLRVSASRQNSKDRANTSSRRIPVLVRHASWRGAGSRLLRWQLTSTRIARDRGCPGTASCDNARRNRAHSRPRTRHRS